MQKNDILPDAINQLVSFTMGDEELSFPISAVQEIIRLPEVTPVPRAPHSVRGIINLRGSILPLLDLRKCLGIGDAICSEDSRVIVLRHQSGKTGMIVDKVNEVLQVTREQIDPPPAAAESSIENGLIGLAKINGGKRVVMILSEDKLFPSAQKFTKEIIGHTTSTSSQGKEGTIEEERLLVSFKLAGEEFAVSITEIREIVRPGNIVRVPHAPDLVLGVMALRDILLPVIDMRIRFGMTSEENENQKEMLIKRQTDARRIIVTDIGGVTTGLQVDAVSEVLRIREKNVDPVPDVFNKDTAKYIQSVCKLNNASRLLMLLDLAGLLTGKEMEEIEATSGKRQEKGVEPMKSKSTVVEEKQLVCFRLADEEYGIDIMQVREIIRLDTITTVPGAPSYVVGIVNLRGNVLPVIDLRQRLGMEGGQRSEQNRILVVEMDGKSTGLIVDAVSEVLRIPESNIDMAPQILSIDVSNRYISGIGNLDDGDRTIIIVNAGVVLENEEIECRIETDRAEVAPSGDTKASMHDESGSAHDFIGKDVNRQEAASVGDEANPSGATKSTQEGGADHMPNNTVELVFDAIEKTETEKPIGKHDGRNIKIQELMAEKKDVLLTKTKKLGIKAHAKMTKQKLAELIVEHEYDG